MKNESTTILLCLPRSLKRALFEYFRNRGTTFSGGVRMLLIEYAEQNKLEWQR